MILSTAANSVVIDALLDRQRYLIDMLSGSFSETVFSSFSPQLLALHEALAAFDAAHLVKQVP